MRKKQTPIIDLSELPAHSNSAYLPIFIDEMRYNVLYGGAGSGKSIAIAHKVMVRILTEGAHRLLVVRKVAKTLRQSVFQVFVELVQDWGLSAYFKINKTDMTIEFTPNGSKLLFFGLDDPEKLKSIQGITSIWIEEASECTLDDFTQLDLRLRGKLKHYKQIILTFNPITAKHWLKARFFDNKDQQATVLKTTYLDNRFLDESYITVLENLKNTNYSYYEIYALGKWGSLEGVIYPEWQSIDKMPTDCEIYKWGQDFGFNHPCATVKIGITGANLYIEELIYQSGITNAQLIKRISDEYPELKTMQGFLDSAEPDRIQEFRNAGYRVLPAKKEVKAGIDKVKSFTIHVVKGSVNVENELDMYCWKTMKNGAAIDEPVKLFDDALDAVRYAVFQGNLGKVGKIGFNIGSL